MSMWSNDEWWNRRGFAADPMLVEWVRDNLDREKLATIATMHESDFESAFGLSRTEVREPMGHDDDGTFYLYRPSTGEDNRILAVAHLDTVIHHADRQCGFLETADGEVCYSGSLDDRLGAYTILDLMPKLGIEFDVLLTTGEEQGMSTAEFFDTPVDRAYNWMIEFDRGGSDVVAYQYEDNVLRAMVRESGTYMGQGSFSDISYLEHLGIKGLNWGVGYRDYHGPRGHVWMDEYVQMMAHFLSFHADNAGLALPHEPAPSHFHGHGFDDEADEDECCIDDIDCNGMVLDTDCGLLCEAHIRMLDLDVSKI